MKKRIAAPLIAAVGFVVGLLNGLFGAGGGMAAVLFLKKCENTSETPETHSDRTAHATSVALVFALTLFTAGLYLAKGNVALADAAFYIPGGIVGSAVGAMFLKKISTLWLKRIFAVFMLYTAYRLIFG